MTDSLKLVPQFVADRSALFAPPFVPEDVKLGEYGFLPYVRTGLAAAISEAPTAPALHATVKAGFEVRASDGTSPAANVERALTLIGPGDLTAIDAAQVIRREPPPNADKVEETFLAHIEFDRPDYPWLFTPLPARGDKLEPWLALVVCDARVSELLPSHDELPAQIHTRLGELQSLAENHYFAHAQVVGARANDGGVVLDLPLTADDGVTSRLSDTHAPANLSRVVCPRRLTPNTKYIAALVPAFDCGVKAGKKLKGGTLGPAWTRDPNNADADVDIVLPVYDSWEFSTGPAGDFRSLAEKLDGIPAPWAIGRRFIDVSQPGAGIAALPQDAAGAIEVLRCALYSPAPQPADAPAEGQWPGAQRAALAARVEQANQDDADLPRVGPRLYARHQAALNRLRDAFANGAFAAETADAWWFTQLNTTPVHRIVAGLGTRVVQANQEALMQAAWAQVEGIRAANRALMLAQFAQRLNQSHYTRRLEQLDVAPLAQLTRAVHSRIRLAAQPRTLAATVTLSRVADATTTLAFRRQVRPLGALSKRADVAGVALPSLQTFADQRVPYANPDGITELSEAGLGIFSDESLGRVLGVPAAGARAAMKQRLNQFSAEGGVYKQLSVREWAPKEQKLGQALGDLVLTRIDKQVASLPADQRGLGIEVSAGISTGLARQPALQQKAEAQLTNVARKTPEQSLRFRNQVGAAQPMAPAAIVGATVRDGARAPIRREAPTVVTRQPIAGAPAPVVDATTVRFESPVSARVSDAVAALDQLTPANMTRLLKDVAFGTGGALAVTSELPALAVTKTQILTQVEPVARSLQRFKGRLARETDFLSRDLLDRRGLAPVMAAPTFRRPMYQALYDYDREWLVPGLGALEQRDMVTLLQVNPAFCESFLIGLSDELGRELLWRSYPTDQRGTYFRRFWDSEQDELPEPIDRFDVRGKQPLGSHYVTGGSASGSSERLVLVVRGELVARYPHLIAAAVRDRPNNNGVPEFSEQEVPILFQAQLPPDYLLVGFDLGVDDLKADDYWFLLAENPTAPRFGMAEENTQRADTTPLNHDALDWDDLTDTGKRLNFNRFLSPSVRPVDIESADGKPKLVRWPSHAGVVARTLLRNPTRAAFQASTLVQAIRSPR